MDDLISRQAAMDAVAEGLKRTFIEYKDVAEKLLNEVPSAEPEIIRCKDCRYNNNCEIQYSAQSGDEFFCGRAERKENE